MDSANGFCPPRKCPLLIIIFKKQKTCFSFSFFITSSHLSNGGRGKGTAHTSPGPAGGRGRLVIRHSRFSSPKGKWAASAAVISCCPSKQETSLEFQTHLLNCITKLVVLPDPCKCLLNVKVVKALRGW